jgi:UDP-N-acetylmuramoylalanine--D-glutamate ligase
MAEHVLVLGAARSGRALAGLLARRGHRVTLADEGPAGEAPPEATAERVTFVAGPFAELETGDVDRVALSPGIPAAHPFVTACRERGLAVEAELEIAWRLARAPCLAVTGTNGKSTVSHLVAAMVERAGRPVRLGGNVGTPFSSMVDDLDESGRFVLEVSSFQLETIRTFHPDVGVILNVAPDHLDRYASMEEYAAAKGRLTLNMTRKDTLVFNAADPACAEIAARTSARGLPFHAEADLPAGVCVTGGRIRIRSDGPAREVLPVERLRIRGYHNLENALAATGAAAAIGLEPDAMAEALASFPGLPHRMEHVGEVDGADWYNDSKATNVDAVIKGLRGLERPVVLIAGGRAKESDFSRMVPHLAGVRAAVLLGEAAGAMEEAFRGRLPLVRAGDLEEAAERAREQARPGDLVLLSPACASFDMFRDFEERGDRFRAIVRGWLGPGPEARTAGGTA